MKSIALKAGLTILLLLILLPLTLILSMKIFSYRFPDREINFIEKVEIGAMDQWIMANGKSHDLPVLLWLHGGPGAAQMPVARFFSHQLEEEFIVVHWDQRGAGKSNPRNFDPGTMTVEQYIADVHQITQYLQRRLNRDRIYILGHSWGTQLGMVAAHRYPEEYIAYIGVGQVVHHHRANILAHLELKSRILEDEKDKDLRLLESLNGPPYKQREDYVSFARLMNRYNMNFDAKIPKLARVAIFSGAYNITELFRWVRGSNRGSGPMWEESQGWDILERAPDVKVPCYFISGGNDFNTPAVLVDEMLGQPAAPPSAKHYIIKEAAHTPFFSRPEEFFNIMRNIKTRH